MPARDCLLFKGLPPSGRVPPAGEAPHVTLREAKGASRPAAGPVGPPARRCWLTVSHGSPAPVARVVEGLQCLHVLARPGAAPAHRRCVAVTAALRAAQACCLVAAGHAPLAPDANHCLSAINRLSKSYSGPCVVDGAAGSAGGVKHKHAACLPDCISLVMMMRVCVKRRVALQLSWEKRVKAGRHGCSKKAVKKTQRTARRQQQQGRQAEYKRWTAQGGVLQGGGPGQAWYTGCLVQM